MKNYCRIDTNARRIVYDREFAKTAFTLGTENYDILQRARADYPKYKVEQRHINKKATQEHYKGLTYEFMDNYIEANGDEFVLKEFRNLMAERKCHSIRYQTIFHWFREHFDMSDYENIAVNAKAEKKANSKAKRIAMLKRVA